MPIFHPAIPEDYVQYLEHNMDAAKSVTVAQADNAIVIEIAADQLVQALLFLRDDARSRFRMLVDITACDYPAKEARFEVSYHLLSLQHNIRARVKLHASEQSLVPSATEVFSDANWFEREVWDMYGVLFSQHPDLRRILTDYGFEGHPQRKDFPLTGYVEVRYDEVQGRVVYEPVKLDQEFRSFDFISPWEGTEYVLPGDEKAKSAS